MYLDYFSLARHPFRITPDPSLFFPGGSRGRGVVLDALVYGITSGEGILKVVGEVGSGKTMLCRMLEEKLPDNIEIVYLANPSLSARDIIYAIAIELDLQVDAATDRLLVMHKLQEYLLEKHGQGGSVVVFIEEAQSMPLETLEEIRLLSNLETHRHKLMQIVLFGQPELDRKLEDKSIRQLRERITHSFHLAPLSEQETREYLHFRLQAAGCPWPQLFSPKAERMLAKAAGGLTRRINILADKALLASYADPEARPRPRNALGEIQSMVLPRHVKTAIADSKYRRLGPGSGVRSWGGYALAALTGAVLLGVPLWFWMERENAPARQTAGMSAESVPPAEERTVPPTLVPQREAEPEPEPNVAAERQADTAGFAAAVQPAGSETSGPDSPGPAIGTEATPVATTARSNIADKAAERTSARVSTAANGGDDGASPAAAERDPGGTAESRSAPALIDSRLASSIRWLDSLPGKNAYTIQLSSMPTGNSLMLENFLASLRDGALLEDTYLCLISATEDRPRQWLVLHGEFAGLSDARRFIERLPRELAQFGPYVRNTGGIACANEGI